MDLTRPPSAESAATSGLIRPGTAPMFPRDPWTELAVPLEDSSSRSQRPDSRPRASSPCRPPPPPSSSHEKPAPRPRAREILPEPESDGPAPGTPADPPARPLQVREPARVSSHSYPHPTTAPPLENSHPAHPASPSDSSLPHSVIPSAPRPDLHREREPSEEASANQPTVNEKAAQLPQLVSSRAGNPARLIRATGGTRSPAWP